jgi:hypothetical protein
LTFGRYEVRLYAYSAYNSSSAITLLDINGRSIWHLTIPGIISNNVLLEYKDIDSARDMIIATSGIDNFNYNRIISSSAPPFTVQSNT